MSLANALLAGGGTDAITEILRDVVVRLRIPQVQLKLYRQFLTANERQDYDEECQHWERLVPIDLWLTRRRRIAHELAIVQLSYRAAVLPLSDRDWLLRELGEELPLDWEIRHAVSLGGLVLVDDPRTVFWDGLKIRIDWRARRKWNLIWQLATKAHRNADLLECDVYPDDAVAFATLAMALLPGGAVPDLHHPDPPSIVPRGQALTVGAKRHATDPSQSVEAEQLLTSRAVPDLHHPGRPDIVPRGQALAVRAERDAARGSRDDDQPLAGRAIPDLYVVPATRRQARTVRTEGHTVDLTGVEGEQLLAASGIPNLRAVVETSRCHPLAVWVERNARNSKGMALESQRLV